MYKRGVLNSVFDKICDDNSIGKRCYKTKIKNCLNYEQPQKYIVDSEKYNDDYLTPVLTANKSFILGYTNECSGIYDKGECIIYDDFTMDMKYVDFHFKVKSSTIKILTANQNNDLYFMFSLLQYLNLKPKGHQRSYISIVEELDVVVPDIVLQNKYGSLFRKLDLQYFNELSQLEKLVETRYGLLQKMFI